MSALASSLGFGCSPSVKPCMHVRARNGARAAPVVGFGCSPSGELDDGLTARIYKSEKTRN